MKSFIGVKIESILLSILNIFNGAVFFHFFSAFLLNRLEMPKTVHNATA